jgi:NAD(P)-dependent dehydrogenase (short-subunit alcohol dehydrogenase family)
MANLNGKVAFISGGTSGIGLATAREFIQQGARVIITGRHLETVRQTVADLGDRAQGFASDASQWTDLSALPERVQALTPQLDILFVNAGSGNFRPIELVDEENFDQQFNVFVKGSYFTVKHLLPLIKEGGAVIFNTSVVTEMGMPGASVYSAAKAAVQSLTKTLAAELVGRGIRVNAVSPGPIQTSFFDKTGMSQEEIQGFAANILPKVPLQRFGQPAEIAKVVAFLASSDSSYMLGTELQVDGGMVQV